jgi:hypothetical protein
VLHQQDSKRGRPHQSPPAFTARRSRAVGPRRFPRSFRSIWSPSTNNEDDEVLQPLDSAEASTALERNYEAQRRAGRILGSRAVPLSSC